MRPIMNAVLWLTLAVSFLIAAGMTVAGEDIFVALCAGRDVLSWIVGEPDYWSFATEGKVWVNQSWLSGLVLCLSYIGLEESGLVLVRLLLLFGCVVTVFLQTRRMNVSQTYGLIAVIAGVLAVAPFLNIRPENFGVLYFVLLSYFLTTPDSQGFNKHVICLLIILLWSNFHGSFVLGLLLIGAKVVAEASRVYLAFRRRTVHRSENDIESDALLESIADRHGGSTIKWATTLGICIPIIAYANPFGPANIFMPFRQTGAEKWTSNMPDWYPLLHWDSIFNIGFLQAGDVTPFLFTLMIVLILAVAVVSTIGPAQLRDMFFRNLGSSARGDILMAVIISLITTALSFKFRRIILFAGFSLVPVIALLLQGISDAITNRWNRAEAPKFGKEFDLLGIGVAGALLILTLWIFSTTTLTRLLPGNPFRLAMSIPKQLVGWNWEYGPIADFMRKNKIRGNIFSCWPLADFFLFHVPDIKIFVDCRAQSFYSDEILSQYASMLNVDPGNPRSVSQALTILDKYNVSAVALELVPQNEPLAQSLMGSGKWLPVYVNHRGQVLMRKDSEVVVAFLKTGDLQGLWYPDDRARIVSTCFLYLFLKGSIPLDLQDRLQQLAQKKPDHQIYWLISRTNLQGKGCLAPTTESYFIAEFKRVSAMNFMAANGASMLPSLDTILGVLERNDRLCHKGIRSRHYGLLRSKLKTTLDELRQTYLGF
jgi:hypothetical protein